MPNTLVKKRRAPAAHANNKRRGTQRQVPTNKLIVLGGVVVCLLVVVFSLYPVVREYYVAVRTNEQLNLELAAVLERNDKIREQILSLQTVEGVEDRAREEFGWVKSGETAVNITGLDIHDSTTTLPTSVKSEDVVVEKTWLTGFLDDLFDVKEPAVAPTIPDPFFSE